MNMLTHERYATTVFLQKKTCYNSFRCLLQMFFNVANIFVGSCKHLSSQADGYVLRQCDQWVLLCTIIICCYIGVYKWCDVFFSVLTR